LRAREGRLSARFRHAYKNRARHANQQCLAPLKIRDKIFEKGLYKLNDALRFGKDLNLFFWLVHPTILHGRMTEHSKPRPNFGG